ncbi:MAG: prepilin-type N-terminal cleavage/methylation domain-containing protein [Phycisphaerae bacterium]|nr:prepilin-type N-terminal cleavage/methylation domain-containing protein [Phycisphaerae bacterium]
MKKQEAFTLIELLVVIAIIGLLLAILIPALNYAKVQASSIVCMANLSGLGKAWVLYAEDNDTEVIGATPHNWNAIISKPFPANPPGPARSVKNFVGSPHGIGNTSQNDTVEDEWRGIQQGGLWPYAESEKLFHCVTDKRYLKPPRGDQYLGNDQFGGTIWGRKGGYRTYSLGAVWNCYTEGWPTDENLVVVYRTGEIVSPGHKIVFLEEQDGSGYNGNTWNFYLNRRDIWGDPFSILHNNRSTFSFADGHAEKHEWKNQSTRDMSDLQVKQRPTNGEREDFDWVREHYVPGKMPPALRNI